MPSAFEMGLSDCRWLYRIGKRTIAVTATAAGDEPAMQWRVSVEGKPCRLLIFGQLVLGERELASAGRVEIDAQRKRFTFRPDPGDRWGEAISRRGLSSCDQHAAPCRSASAATNCSIATAMRRSGGYAAIRTKPVNAFAFAVVGSMTDSKRAKALAAKYASLSTEAAMLRPADRFWSKLTRGIRIRDEREDKDAQALDTIFPWLAHDMLIHLTVPHGLEQYTGGAWGIARRMSGSGRVPARRSNMTKP